jgi:hypothetical protein
LVLQNESLSFEDEKKWRDRYISSPPREGQQGELHHLISSRALQHLPSRRDSSITDLKELGTNPPCKPDREAGETAQHTCPLSPY